MKPSKLVPHVLVTALAFTSIAMPAANAQPQQPQKRTSKKPQDQILPDLNDLITLRGNENRGGDGVPVNGVLRLRDLVDPTICGFVPGSKVLAEVPANQQAYNQIITRLAQVDWYLAFVLDRATKNMVVCKTRYLRSIWTNDFLFESVHVPFALTDKRQLAIRDFYTNEVFLDVDATSASVLLPADFPYLMLHEAAHEFISTRQPRYYMRLRTFIHTLSQVVGNQLSQDDFNYSNQHVGLSIPAPSSLRDRMQTLIRFALAPANEKTAILAAASEPAELLIVDQSPYEVTANLLAQDAYQVRQLISNPFQAAVLQVCLSEDRDLMSRIQASAQRIRPYEYDFAAQCLALREVQEDAPYSAFLMSISHTPKIVEHFLNELANKSLVKVNDEAWGTEPYRWLALTSTAPDGNGLTSTDDLRRLESSVRFGEAIEGSAALDRRTQLFFDSLSAMIRWMRPAEVLAVVTPSSVRQALLLTPRDLELIGQLQPTPRMIFALTYPQLVKSFVAVMKTHLTKQSRANPSATTDAVIGRLLSVFNDAAPEVDAQLAPYQSRSQKVEVQK